MSFNHPKTKKKLRDCDKIAKEYDEEKAVNRIRYSDFIYDEGKFRCIPLHELDIRLAKEMPPANWLKKQEKYIESLSTIQQEFIALYTLNGYSMLNRFLNNYIVTPEVEKMFYGTSMTRQLIDHIKKIGIITIEEFLLEFDANISIAIKNAPVTLRKFVVYRGENFPLCGYTHAERCIIKQMYSTSQYVSTSLNFIKPKDYITRIIVPKGTKCLYIKNLSLISDEEEILFDHNSIFQTIQPHHTFNDFIRYTIKYIGQKIEPQDKTIDASHYIDFEKL